MKKKIIKKIPAFRIAYFLKNKQSKKNKHNKTKQTKTKQTKTKQKQDKNQTKKNRFLHVLPNECKTYFFFLFFFFCLIWACLFDKY